MDQEELAKKAQRGEKISQKDIDDLTKNTKKDAYKKAAIGSAIGLIIGFIPNLIRRFFRK